MEKMIINNEFLKTRPLSATSIKAFRKSPRHYLMYLQKLYVPSDAMILGSVIDTLALTPELYDKRFSVFNKATGKGSIELNRKTKEQAAEKRITLITPEMLRKAKAAVESLYSHYEAKQLLDAKKDVQKRLRWRNSGLPFIGYIDFAASIWETDFIVDLKSTKNADPDRFMRDAANLDYEMQPAAYLDAYHRNYYQHPNFIFLAVENDEPYNVSINFCDNKYIERAKSEFAGTVKAFKYCMENYPDFDIGYEFRLMGTGNYFGMEIPRYKKSLFANY